MAQGAHNVGVVQILGEGHLHGGPIWGALYVLVLLWCYDLKHIQALLLALTLDFLCILQRKHALVYNLPCYGADCYTMQLAWALTLLSLATAVPYSHTNERPC